MVTVLAASLSINKHNTALHCAVLFLTTLTTNTLYSQHTFRLLSFAILFQSTALQLILRCFCKPVSTLPFVFLSVCFVTFLIVSRWHCLCMYAGSCVVASVRSCSGFWRGFCYVALNEFAVSVVPYFGCSSCFTLDF